jgi:hypothetical protein
MPTNHKKNLLWLVSMAQKKGSQIFLCNPLFLLVEAKRIELSTSALRRLGAETFGWWADKLDDLFKLRLCPPIPTAPPTAQI